MEKKSLKYNLIRGLEYIVTPVDIEIIIKILLFTLCSFLILKLGTNDVNVVNKLPISDEIVHVKNNERELILPTTDFVSYKTYIKDYFYIGVICLSALILLLFIFMILYHIFIYYKAYLFSKNINFTYVCDEYSFIINYNDKDGKAKEMTIEHTELNGTPYNFYLKVKRKLKENENRG